ncbi:MAG TPA: hypothetical protein PLU88_01545 [Armatimonadota bacterium]|nr:hypothetical protein [Armatimonadota bacterium]
MRCKCGNQIDNVPEHLVDLATWVCQKCTNTAPKPAPVIEQEDEPLRKRIAARRSSKAA